MTVSPANPHPEEEGGETYLELRLVVLRVGEHVRIDTKDFSDVDVGTIGIDLRIIGLKRSVAHTVHFVDPSARASLISCIPSASIKGAYSLFTTVYTFVQSCPEIPRQIVSPTERLSQFSATEASLTRASWKVETPYLVAIPYQHGRR